MEYHKAVCILKDAEGDYYLMTAHYDADAPEGVCWSRGAMVGPSIIHDAEWIKKAYPNSKWLGVLDWDNWPEDIGLSAPPHVSPQLSVQFGKPKWDKSDYAMFAAFLLILSTFIYTWVVK